MHKDEWASWIGWGFVVLSAVVGLATMMGRHGGRPLLPQLVPVFGIAFGALYLIIQAGFCLWLRSWIGLGVLAAALLAGFLLGGIREARWQARNPHRPPPRLEKVLDDAGLSTHNYDWRRHRFLTGVCLSGLAVGYIGIRRTD